MDKKNLRIYMQKSPYDSPWRMRVKMTMFLWGVVWTLLCSWTPKPFNAWRIFWLRLFGAKIRGKPFLHQRARIEMPWSITIEDRASVGDGSVLYSLGAIEIKARAIIAQEAYICTATHEFSDPALPLVTANITIGEDAFIGTRAFIMPGVIIGDGALIGACSVVTNDMPAWTICFGNPCKPVKPRQIHK